MPHAIIPWITAVSSAQNEPEFCESTPTMFNVSTVQILNNTEKSGTKRYNKYTKTAGILTELWPSFVYNHRSILFKQILLFDKCDRCYQAFRSAQFVTFHLAHTAHHVQLV